MHTFRAKILCMKVRNFTALKDIFNHLAGKGPSLNFVNATRNLLRELDNGLADCKALGLADAEKTLTRVRRAVATGKLDASRLIGEAMRAHDALVDDIDKRTYIYIPPELGKYVDQDALFGPLVAKKFPGLRTDIRAAANCVALDLGTAAVFHLMRAAEHGLRAVARKLSVKLTHKGRRQPIEYADWGTVINGIRSKINSLRALSAGPVRQRSLDFYSDIADQREYMKDIWRNTISHTRQPYSAAEAERVMHRVENFMGRVATDLRRMH
jgi:hypothetical protein